MKTLTASRAISRVETTGPGVLGLWHLLSLDAPTVATTWMVFVARVAHVPLPFSVACAMFLAVWAVYATDRLLDGRRMRNLEARHRFHRRYGIAFSVGLAGCGLALVPLIAAMPVELRAGYAALSGLLMLWLALVHLGGRSFRMPKEIVVGGFFSAAVFMPVMMRGISGGMVAAAVVFANLCSLNCLFIYAWEHPWQRDAEAHRTTFFGLRMLQPIALASVILPIAVMQFAGASVSLILLAASLAAAALLLLHRLRARLDCTDLRAAADLALLTPLLFLPFLR